jgi:exodeoxyribonuclease VII small subunit
VAKQKPPGIPRDSSDSGTRPPTFEESLARLEEIAAQLEDGRLGLSESLACYEEGVKHLKLCYQLLEQAERRIELLAGVDAEGNAITRPFDDAALTLEEKAQSRTRGRREPVQTPTEGASKPNSDDIDDEGLLF